VKRPRQQSRLAIPGKTLVRNSLGKPILCAWDDCESVGYDEIKIVVKEPGKDLHYIFCSPAHRRFHIASHNTYGKLAP
jgi:hypothetical protein